MPNIRIMIVEDDDLFVRAMKETLSSLGYEMTATVPSGELAVQTVAANPPDLVLMDITLPGEIDGIEAAARIRASHDIPILYLTALSDAVLVDRIKATEPFGYLLKPFQKQELRIAIDMALHRHKLETELRETNRRLAQEIIEHKWTEEELKQYRNHLEVIVAERTAELTTVNTHLQQEIMEHKQAEEALRASERQYRLLVEHVADGIGIIQDEQLVFVNDALASMLGYTAAQLIQETPIDLFHGAYKAQVGKLYEQLEQQVAEPQWQVLEFVVTGQGKELWMEGRHSVIVWQGKPAMLVTMRDITERKRKEQKIKQEGENLRQENIRLRSAMKDRYKFGELIGKSRPMQDVYELILKASATDASVVIYGESGTGKDLIAQTIHQLSNRREKTFIPVNCGSIPETLFEREFFGHRKGTFTGALADKPGLFDATHQGTLFLDEVGELPLTIQVKLLRAIEGKGYIPVGDQTVRYADVRLIAATNKNLKDQVKQGLMREDFFYRINIITITVPPLRDRREDIPLLIEHFLKQYRQQEEPQVLPGRILELLYNYPWPGNIRQLQNVLQRYLTLQRLDFADDLQETELMAREIAAPEAIVQQGLGFNEAVQMFEKRLIVSALERNRWHRTKTAALLGIPRRSLLRKMQQYGLQ
jgi:PAS domain S-box-containing protein